MILLNFICIIVIFDIMSCEEEASSKNNMALAIYEPSKILTIFETDTREFTFAGCTVNISQNWEKKGVAAVVWDAAVILARYLETSADLVGKKVIELGSGTGLVGIVAGYLGAQIIITDRKIVLGLAHDNVQRNSQNLKTTLIDVRELEWGQDVSSFNPPFEYILGADIVYIEETFPKLLKTITELCDDKTVVLLSCKIRYKRDETFFHLLNETFEVTQILYDKTTDIYIYKAVRRLGTLN